MSFLRPASLAAALGVLVGAAACSKHTPPSAQPAPLATATVSVRSAAVSPQPATEAVTGTVRARLRAVLEAKLGGRVEELAVAPGQAVKAGDLLAQLDAREAQARLEQAAAVRDQAESDRQRFAALWQQEAVTRAEYDAVQARSRVAEAGLVEAQTQLAHTRVAAPFDGVISRKFVERGDQAAPGKPLLELEDPRQLQLEIGVPEALRAHLHIGTTLPVRLASSGPDLTGTVVEIAPAADPQSRTFLTKLALPPREDIRTGAFGRAFLALGEATALRVPAEAVLQRGQLELAFVAQNEVAHLRLVRTGKRVGDQVEIVSGLETNDLVIVSGLATLVDGQPIRLNP